MPNIFIPLIKRFEGLKGKKALGISLQEGGLFALSGLLLGLSAPGYGGWLLAWLGLIPAFYIVLKASDWKTALTGGLLTGLVFHALYLAWFLGLHPLTWLGFSEVASLLSVIFVWLLATGLSSLIFAVLFLILYGCRKNSLPVVAGIFPLLWVVVYGSLGSLPVIRQIWVPWALLDYTQAGLPLMRQLAGLFGTGAAIAAVLVFHNLFFALLFNRAWLNVSGATFRGDRSRRILLAGLAPMLVFTGGLGVDQAQPTQRARPFFSAPVTILQGNLPIDVVRSSDKAESAAWEAYLTPLSTTKIAESPLPERSLVILPEEGPVPGWVTLAKPDGNPEFSKLQETATRKNLGIITGLSTDARDRYGRSRQYNSLAVILPGQPPVFYHKRRLVPFGEEIPPLVFPDSAWFNGLLSVVGVSYTPVFEAGPADQRPLQTSLTAAAVSTKPENVPPSFRLGPLICFELVYPELARRYQKQGASLLVNSSNLGWFHGNGLLEEQFLAVGQLRAAETGLPLVISANTGVSAFIDGQGHVMARTRSQHKDIITR